MKFGLGAVARYVRNGEGFDPDGVDEDEVLRGQVGAQKRQLGECPAQIGRSIVNRGGADGFDDILARSHDSTKNGVPEIQARTVGDVEIPLASGAVESSGPRHGERAAGIYFTGFEGNRRISRYGDKHIGNKLEPPTLHDLDTSRIVGCAAVDDAAVVGTGEQPRGREGHRSCRVPIGNAPQADLHA